MKTLILVHGRNWKPARTDLRKLWLDALAHGIKRDAPEALCDFNAAKKEFVYYGDISNAFLKEKNPDEPIPDDTQSRRDTLNQLKAWNSNQFTKSNYNKLPGKESFREGVADVLSPLLRFFRLSDDLINLVAPDMGEYWKGEDSSFGSSVREPMIAPLKRAMDSNDSVCVLAHSLGSMIAYDTLWKFSYRSEYRPKYDTKKVDLFMTLGSPLADETVKGGLFGARASGPRKYPNNIRRWVNIAAEDDFISHDQKVADDFKKMKRYGNVDSIKDHRIYNLALRKGKSNPHHSGGYLLHPKTTSTLVEWLKSE